MAAFEDAAAWAAELERLGACIAPHFGRVEPRRRALAYLRGLLAPLERKNGWQLAEAAGDATPDGMQDFLSRMRWDADRVRDDLQAYVALDLGDPDAVLVLDETGFVKKGTHSVGVQRQYSGTAGRIENCQIGVFLAYASKKGHALIDRALYLPERWAGDAARRAQAGVPEAVAFVTKPKLGLAMLQRVLMAGVPFAWVTGDSVYGSDHRLRRLIERHGRGYVLAVTSAQRLGLKPVADWLEDVPARGWQRLSAGDGAKGPRLYDWAYLPYRSLVAQGWKTGLLIRRKIGQPAELAFYLTLAPAAASLAELVRVAGMRWTIEACFPPRTGWRRPGTPASRRPRARSASISTRCAPGPAGIGTSRFPCSPTPIWLLCAKQQSGGEVTVERAADLLPITVPEVRRLLWRLVWARPPDPARVIAWSLWRRRHQQRARRCHWHRRTGHDPRL
jgi:SRSO17 transposase